jgi:hypothetical protein
VGLVVPPLLLASVATLVVPAVAAWTREWLQAVVPEPCDPDLETGNG